MLNTKTARHALILSALAGVPMLSNATITVYTSQASFLSAVTTSAVDSFNDLAVGLLETPLGRSVGGFGYTIDTTGGYVFNVASGSDIWLSPDQGNDTLSFGSFSSNVWAVGAQFFLTDINGSLVSTGSLTIVATDAGGTVTRTLTNPGTSTFLGFVSDGPLSSLTVVSGTTSAPFQWPTVNNLTLASVVPEPASWLLLVGGLATAGLAARRQRQDC